MSYGKNHQINQLLKNSRLRGTHCLPRQVTRMNLRFCPEDEIVEYPRKLSQSLSDSTSSRDKNTTLKTLLQDYTATHPRKKHFSSLRSMFIQQRYWWW